MNLVLKINEMVCFNEFSNYQSIKIYKYYFTFTNAVVLVFIFQIFFHHHS